MAIARKHLVSAGEPGCYHLVSRCVRRAFLCGVDRGVSYEHRRDWVVELTQQAARSYALSVFSYSVLQNHFHLVVRHDPSRAQEWSDREVVERWCAAHPKHPHGPQPQPWSPEEQARFLANPRWVARHRERLGSLSWFMKAIKEPLAKRANREDGCTGHFWEGRFRSTRLLDQAAVIACMVYNDLNPIRAGIADRPETSDFTSIQERCQARVNYGLAESAEQTHADAGLWIAPIACCALDGQHSHLTLDEYCTLVDRTGRMIREGKRGHIPPILAPILDRLQFDHATWLATMRRPQRMLGAAIGHLAARAIEASRRGVAWIVDTVAGLYREPVSQ
jgi:putative transposase